MKRINICSILIFISLCLICTACRSQKGGNSEEAIANEEVYPSGDIVSARFFDDRMNEEALDLDHEDIDYIINTIKSSSKEVITSYDSQEYINIQFADSVIQLIRADAETVYYVFHNNEICGVCYKIESEELSEWILELSEDIINNE